MVGPTAKTHGGSNRAFYTGFIDDVHADSLTVVFEKNWQPEHQVPFNKVRLPTPPDMKEISKRGEVEVNPEQMIKDLADGGWLKFE